MKDDKAGEADRALKRTRELEERRLANISRARTAHAFVAVRIALRERLKPKPDRFRDFMKGLSEDSDMARYLEAIGMNIDGLVDCSERLILNSPYVREWSDRETRKTFDTVVDKLYEYAKESVTDGGYSIPGRPKSSMPNFATGRTRKVGGRKDNTGHR